MKAVIVENNWLNGVDHGWGNGYVIIPKNHELHDVDYEEIDVNVHGGLTYSELVTEETLPYLGLTNDDIGSWAVGFDTCHYKDSQANWPKERVQEEVNNLLEQLLNYKTE